MFRARERGMSFWPFAISLLLLVVLVVMWFSVSSERDQAKAQARAAEAKAADADTKLKERLDTYMKASGVVGFAGGGGFTDAEAVEAARKEYAEKLKGIAVLEFPTKRYTVDPAGGQTTSGPGDTVKVMYLTDAELNDTPTMQSFLSKVEVAMQRMRTDIARYVAQAGQAVEDKERAAKSYEDTLREKDARITAVLQEKTALQGQMDEKVRELTEKLTQKDAAIAQKDQDLEAVRKQSSENETKLVAQNTEQAGTIRSLVQREAPALSEGPDGEVIIATDDMAIINRGKQHWLMPGTIFEVWGRAKGGAMYKKGTLKVTNVDDETARAAIVEQMPKDPITRGDLIQSQLYSPNRQLHFVLVGEFKKMGRSQAEALLKKLGAVVDAKVTADTNYVVVGTPGPGQENLDDSEAVKAAKDLGIKMITEEALGSFARY